MLRRNGSRAVTAGALTGFGVGAVLFLLALVASRWCSHTGAEQLQPPARVEAPARR